MKKLKIFGEFNLDSNDHWTISDEMWLGLIDRCVRIQRYTFADVFSFLYSLGFFVASYQTSLAVGFENSSNIAFVVPSIRNRSRIKRFYR